MAAKKGKKLISVDFTGVEAGSAGKLLPEGPTKFEVVDITKEIGEESEKEYLLVELAVCEGEENEGTKAYDNMSLQPQALWKLRGFLDACGIETEDGPMDIDPDEIIGMVVMGDVIHEEYKSKTKHRLAGYTSVDQEEAAPAKAKGAVIKKKPAKAADEEEESSWKVKQKVTFKDGKKTISGVIKEIDGETITVKAGNDEYEVGPADLEAA